MDNTSEAPVRPRPNGDADQNGHQQPSVPNFTQRPANWPAGSAWPFTSGAAKTAVNSNSRPSGNGRAWTNPPGGICKICDHKGTWCQESSDGEIADCRRVDTGAFKTTVDGNGAYHHFHRLKGDRPDVRDDRPKVPELDETPSRAHPNVLHEVYSSLLAGLPISAGHRTALQQRGLADGEIDRRGYGTKPDGRIDDLLRRLYDRFGNALLSVPGFVRDGHGRLAMACLPGILIPVRDTEGRVIAMKVRPDKVMAGSKYLWLSSARRGGPKAPSACHVPLGIKGPVVTLRITEGELKADVATVLSGDPTISAPGVSNWKPALTTARELGAERIRIAYDMDATTNQDVAKARDALAAAAAKAGLVVEIEEWDPKYKGIDDALKASEATQVRVDRQAPPPKRVEEKPGATGDYITTLSGVPRSCVTNAMAWLKTKGPRLEYDTFRDRIVVDGEPLRDGQIVELVAAMERDWENVVAKVHVDDALRTLAHRNRFSSLEGYLKGLQWDGTPRIEDFFVTYYGADHCAYTREVGRVFFISGAARGLQPGCKADVLPLLIGPQGTGKSHGMAALCPDPTWFTDEVGNIAADRAGENLRGKWIVEAAELDRVNQAALSAMKKFIACQQDRYKVPYEREPRDFPRTCVFVGSTNDDCPLRDFENRRFHPLRIPGRTEKEKAAAIEGIVAVRDQLWAEAVHRFRAGEKWWTTDPEVGTKVKEEVETARESDAWEDLLAERLEHQDRTTVIEAAKLLEITPDRLGRSEQMRISKALKKIGFKRERENTPPRAWYYERESVPT